MYISKMHIRILTLLAVLLVRNAASEGDDEVKRGTFPYMAFIYYPDDSVVDKNGVRVTRAGILVKPDWLITSSLETDDVALAFPKKTLVARLGSVTIDGNFSFNEDEEEQESEIIQIIRPYNFTVVEWWFSDISLLQTLIPFNKTSSVGNTVISPKPDFNEKECFILVYARKISNKTNDRFLMQIPVQIILPPSKNCGSYFRENTMICAQDIDEKKNVSYDSNFCSGNGGGPLICDTDINGLQTYSNGCREPHLYQLFSGWAKFISCGIQKICQEKECDKVCNVISKDSEIPKPKEMMILVSNELSTKETTKLEPIQLSAGDDNISGEEASPEKPTATTIIDHEVTTPVQTTTSLPVESIADTLVTSETQSTNLDEGISRRSNVEAQQQPIKKKSSASILTPLSIQLLIFWMTVHFI